MSVCFVQYIVDHFSCVYMRVLLDEVTCPYSCYYESVRQPGGQLLNETYGCHDQCDPTFGSTDKCREVIGYLLQVPSIIALQKKLTCFCSGILAGHYLDMHARCTVYADMLGTVCMLGCLIL